MSGMCRKHFLFAGRLVMQVSFISQDMLEAFLACSKSSDAGSTASCYDLANGVFAVVFTVGILVKLANIAFYRNIS